MFVLESVEEPVTIPGVRKTSRHYVIDRERAYACYPLTGVGRGRTRALILVGGSDVVPFETWFENPFDEAGIRMVSQHISSFGRSYPVLEQLFGVKAFEFNSESQERELLEIAAEAVLVLTCDTVDRFISDEGRVKVHAGDRTYTRRSFGLLTLP